MIIKTFTKEIKMKKILSFVFAFVAITAHAEISDPMSNQFGNTGVVSKQDKVFIKVKNGESSSIGTGSVVVYSTSADDGATIASGSTAGMPAACVIAETCASGAKCLCQKRGYHSAVKFDAAAGAAAAGEAAFHSATAYYVKSNDSVAAGHMHLGTFLDTISATGTVEMVLQIP